MNSCIGILSVAGFVLGVITLCRDRLVPRHCEYQGSRQEIDGFTLPWFMCWSYQFGLEHKVGPKRSPTFCMCKEPARIALNDLNCQRCGKLVTSNA